MAQTPKNSEEDSLITSYQDSDGNVDKIRQILFGVQMRDYEQRFDTLEKRITQNVEQITAQLEGRFERLSKRTQEEMDKIGAKIDAERKERLAENKDAGGELLKLKALAENQFVQLNEHFNSENKALHNALLDQNDELSTLIRNTCDQISIDLHQKADEIADRKLGREDLAALFADVATKLKNDA